MTICRSVAEFRSGRHGHPLSTYSPSPKRGWHGFRRGLATNLQSLGVDLKTTQKILRHAQISTTANLYVGEVAAQSKTAMKRLERIIQKYEIPDNAPLILQ